MLVFVGNSTRVCAGIRIADLHISVQAVGEPIMVHIIVTKKEKRMTTKDTVVEVRPTKKKIGTIENTENIEKEGTGLHRQTRGQPKVFNLSKNCQFVKSFCFICFNYNRCLWKNQKESSLCTTKILIWDQQ